MSAPVPWIQRWANALTPEVGDAVIVAMAVLVMLGVLAASFFGWAA
jgi:hypothetical protein